MAGYRIYFRQSALRDLDKIPKRDLRRIVKRIASLADDPRPPGNEKLSGESRYRVRQGNYRILYSIQDAESSVWIVKVGLRKDVYRNPVSQ